MAFKSLQQKRQFVNGQAAILDTNGIQRGKAFTFKTTRQSYHHDLGKRLKQIIPSQVDNDHIVFAICNPTLTENSKFRRCLNEKTSS